MAEDTEGLARLLSLRPLAEVRHKLRDAALVGVAVAFLVAGALAVLAALGVLLAESFGPVIALLIVAMISLLIGLGLFVFVQQRAETERRIAAAEAEGRQAVMSTVLGLVPRMGAGGSLAVAALVGLLLARGAGKRGK